MLDWFRARYAEASTHAGIASVLVTISTMLPADSGWRQIVAGTAVLLGGMAVAKHN